ncbi:MAG: MFS transporter [Burkholderiaceae bacterium]|nr:MFS transporter [Burkholderiaceae bacterium]
MPSGPLRSGVRRREVWAWAMYDFANSGYTTVVITAVFNAYFVAVVAGNAPWATLAWTAALGLSALIVLLTAQWLGAWADAHAGKKKLLALSTLGCVLATAGLALAGPGSVALALGFLVLSNVCFGTGENLIAAFLPELATEDSLGKVSGWGWGLGYLGGLLSLAACLAVIAGFQARGGQASAFVPWTMLLTAALFALAAVPTFVFLRERGGAPATPSPALAAVAQAQTPAPASAWQRTLDTLRHTRRYRDMGRFMLCILFYQAGIQAVIALAAIYAEQAMGFSTAQTVQLVVAVNLAAALGALAFGQWQDRIGHVRAIRLTLWGWLATVALAWAAQTPAPFWAAASLAGLCLGASQSAARALVGYLAPPQRQAEFFGLWGLAVKGSAILGPMAYGLVTWLTNGNHRLALLAMGAYFLVGLWLLAGVDAQRGRHAALAGD